jgi:acetolactate synthase I/II/III large subunit
VAERIGGHVVAESLAALGAGVAFGVPGVHSLAIWEGLRTGPVRAYASRTELAAGFAADGYARSSRRPAPLLLSTGPGALNSLTAVMEAASSHVPVVVISSQIPGDLIGRGRGYLHETADQLASFAPLVRYAARAHSAESIPGLLAQAWRTALTPPSGPVYLEIPVDLLKAPAAVAEVSALEAMVERQCAPLDQVALAADALAGARRPVIWAGGGVIRSGAAPELRELAERLDAPVATTYMGKGAIADQHPLAAGSGCDEAALQELLADADVLLCVGTELGAETTAQYMLDLRGQLIHVDAAPERIGVTYSALPLIGDAKLTLLALVAELHPRPPRDGAAQVAAVRRRIRSGLDEQDRSIELGLLTTIEQALPVDAVTVWDMTILAYWAAPHLRLRGGQQFLYPLGSGTLGYAWPAALGAAVAQPGRPVLAVVGDGGLQYCLGELGTAAQHRIAAKLLVVDDGGYGILRQYQREQYGETTAVDLPGQDLAAVAAGFGVPVRRATPADLAEHLAWAWDQEGPAAVVLGAQLVPSRPTR